MSRRWLYTYALVLLVAGSLAWGRSTSFTGGERGGSGTVTSVTCGAGLSGGTFTTAGTCLIPGGGITNAMLSSVTALTGFHSFGITAPAVNTTALVISGASHTGSDATSDVSLATTLNTSGAAVVDKLAVACTTSITAGCPNAFIEKRLTGAAGTTVARSLDTSGNEALGGAVSTGGSTVAGLAAAIPSPVVGMRYYVTDQLTVCPAVGAALTGLGLITCPVFYNGSTWVGG